MVQAIKNIYNIQLQIKLPNDIIYNNKKIGGILTQSILNGKNVKYIMIGIGLNTIKENFTEDIENIATSIKKEFGIEVDRIKIITEFCNLFEKDFLKRLQIKF